jgi:hypothetical protein
MNNLILNLDAQLWVFDSTPDSQKFAIENSSSKKVRKVVLALVPLLLSFFTSGKVAADPFTVYKDGKKLNNFFETNEIIPISPPTELVHLRPDTFLMLLTFLNSLRESKRNQEIITYLKSEQLNQLKNKEVLITLLVQGGEIAKSVVLISYSISIIGLALSFYLGQKEEMKEHFKNLRQKKMKVFVTELLSVIITIIVNDRNRILAFCKNRKIQMEPEVFLSYVPRAITLLILLVIVKKYGRTIWYKSIEIRDDWPRIVTSVNEFISRVYDGDWNYKLRRKKLILQTALLRKKLSLQKIKKPLLLKDWLIRKYSILIREGRVKEYERLLRVELLGRLKLLWFIFKENQKSETPLLDLDWAFVIILLYNNRL